MCNSRNSAKIAIDGKLVKVDRCMAGLIKFINHYTRFKLLSCCCGHGKYPMTVVVEWGVKGYHVEIISDKTIPRKRRFYIKDREGLYYIPETMKDNRR